MRLLGALLGSIPSFLLHPRPPQPVGTGSTASNRQEAGHEIPG